MSEAIERAVAPDRQHRATFYRRDDGYYEFSIDKYYAGDVPEYDHDMEYWSPLHFSGLYDSLATAKREAIADFPWIATSA